MDYPQVLTLLAFLFPLAYSPGPGNTFFAAIGARFGLRATLGATTGYHIATFAITLPIGLGFSSAIEAAPGVFQVIELAGSLYVLYLAFKLCRSGATDANQRAKPANFWDGVILLILNPKAYVIIALMFSQFTTDSSSTTEVAAIAALFTLNNLVAFTLWTAAGARLARSFRTAAHARMLNSTLGGTLALVGIWMLLY